MIVSGGLPDKAAARSGLTGCFIPTARWRCEKPTIAGLGIALLPEYCVAADLAAGALVRVLPQCEIRRPVMALFARSPHIPQKIRLLVTFLAEWFKQDRVGSLPADRRLGRAPKQVAN